MPFSPWIFTIEFAAAFLTLIVCALDVAPETLTQ
jgi:hypothetical protein